MRLSKRYIELVSWKGVTHEERRHGSGRLFIHYRLWYPLLWYSDH